MSLPSTSPLDGSRASKRQRTADGDVRVGGGTAQPPKSVALWRSGTFTDVEITVAGSTFSAHRLVLAAHSDFMHALFSGPYRDSGMTELHDMDAVIFDSVVGWMYEGDTVVPEASLPLLLEAATRLQVLPLVDHAARALRERLDGSTALATYLLAEKLTLPALERDAHRAALRDFRAASLTPAFLDLSLAQLEALLKEERLTVSSRATHGALPHRAPSPRCTADSVHHDR